MGKIDIKPEKNLHRDWYGSGLYMTAWAWTSWVSHCWWNTWQQQWKEGSMYLGLQFGGCRLSWRAMRQRPIIFNQEPERNEDWCSAASLTFLFFLFLQSGSPVPWIAFFIFRMDAPSIAKLLWKHMDTPREMCLLGDSTHSQVETEDWSSWCLNVHCSCYC